jgi:hypothetical protein
MAKINYCVKLWENLTSTNPSPSMFGFMVKKIDFGRINSVNLIVTKIEGSSDLYLEIFICTEKSK